MRRILKVLAFVVVVISLVAPLNAQDYILEVSDTLSIPDDCKTIYTGTFIFLGRGNGVNACNADVMILKDGDPTPFFRTSDMSFSLSFTEPGEYVVFCGAPTIPASLRFATTAACFTVLPKVVPAMTEWALIVLGLLMLISSVLFLKRHDSPNPLTHS